VLFRVRKFMTRNSTVGLLKPQIENACKRTDHYSYFTRTRNVPGEVDVAAAAGGVVAVAAAAASTQF